MLAIGMAFAVLIDASLVRMILVPAIMSLLGAHAWRLPRWLAPVVPNLQLEGQVDNAKTPVRCEGRARAGPLISPSGRRPRSNPHHSSSRE